MTKKQEIALCAEIERNLPDAVAQSPTVFMKPLGTIYRGICIESTSREKDTFYLNVFFIPLFLPIDRLMLNLAYRLNGNGGHRSIHDFPKILSSIKEEAWPVLKKIKSTRDLPAAIKQAGVIGDPFAQLTLLYTGLELSDRKGMANATEALARMLSGRDKIEWQKNLWLDAQVVNEQAKKSKVEIDTFLTGRRQATAKALKLTAFL